jgi:sec-independent protein translocase protein TatA
MIAKASRRCVHRQSDGSKAALLGWPMLSPPIRSGLSHLFFEGTLMFGIGTTELVVIGIVVLVLFGSRLPTAMKSLGQGLKQFKDGLNSDA